MLIPALQNFNLRDWIDQAKNDWGERPIRVFWESDDYIGLVSRGPTRGKEYHVGPGDEIFYQVSGDLYLNYMAENGEHRLVTVAPGELFLLPAKVPHAPRRRDADCWTLVIERRRRPQDIDSWVWFCEQCQSKLYETPARTAAGPSNAPNAILREADQLLRVNESMRTCSQCSAILSLPLE